MGLVRKHGICYDKMRYDRIEQGMRAQQKKSAMPVVTNARASTMGNDSTGSPLAHSPAS